jgi:hypothetical protein
MQRNSILAFDGAWGHRRHAKECIVMLVDLNQKRIVDFAIILKPKPGVKANWDGSPNGMELAGVKELIERWKDNENVGGIVHDNDSKATAAINAAQWKVKQWYDPNHVIKQFERCWKSCTTTKLRGFHAKLLMWFRHLLRSDYTIEQKKNYWRNALEHFRGNHEKCPHEHPEVDKLLVIKTAEQEEQLVQFLEATVELLERCLTGVHTNFNESCNALKIHYADKNTSWKGSWSARMMCAIMQVNSLENWRIELARRCGVHLTARAVARLEHVWAEHLELHRERPTEEYRLKESRRRWQLSHQDTPRTPGFYDYRLPEHDGMCPYEDAVAADRTIAEDEPNIEFERLVRNEIRDARPRRELDDGEDGPEHLELLDALPPGTVLSDEFFDVQGMAGDTLVIAYRFNDHLDDSPFDAARCRGAFAGNLPVEIIGTFRFGGAEHYRVRFEDGTFGGIGSEFLKPAAESP